MASDLSVEPYAVIAFQIGEALSRLNPEEVTKENVENIITEIWQNAFNLDAESLRSRVPQFARIAAWIVQGVDKAQELDPS